MKKCFIKYLKKIQALQVEVAGKGSFHVESYKFLNTEDDKEVIDYLFDATVNTGDNRYERFVFYSWQKESQYEEEYSRLCEYLQNVGWLD